MKVKLITHTDLDGVGCVLDCFFAFGEDNVDWQICNYDKIDQIVIDEVVNDITVCKRYDLILIADISPNEPVFWEIDKLGAKNIWAFDHHKSRAFADRFSFVIFDQSRCGAKILFDWFLQRGYLQLNDETIEFSKFIDAINAYDLWDLIDVPNKSLGDSYNRLLHSLGFKGFVNLNLNEIIALEQKLRNSLKEKEENIVNDICKNAFQMIDENGRQFVAFLSNGPSPQSGHELLKRYSTARYAVAIQLPTKTVSLYSRSGEYDVSTLAQARHPKGGGHANASGYRLPENIIHDVIKLILKGN